jgi:hypothetical protein
VANLADKVAALNPDAGRFAKPGADWFLLYPDEMAQETISLFGTSPTIMVSPGQRPVRFQSGEQIAQWMPETVAIDPAPAVRGKYRMTANVQIKRSLAKLFWHSMGNGNYPAFLLRSNEAMIAFGINAAIRVPKEHFEALYWEFQALGEIEPIPCPNCRCGADLSIEPCRFERLSRVERLGILKSGEASYLGYSSRLHATTGHSPTRDDYNSVREAFDQYLTPRGYVLNDLETRNGGDVDFKHSNRAQAAQLASYNRIHLHVRAMAGLNGLFYIQTSSDGRNWETREEIDPVTASALMDVNAGKAK